MINVEKIKPTGLFTNYIYKAIPLAFDESMSYYETLLGLLHYLKNSVIPALNNNADAIIEVQNLMTQLQNYVNNYFNNLDVQDEINNKLDAMVEDGTLENIINQKIFGEIKNYIKEDNLLKNKPTICIGDSYLVGGSSNGTNWGDLYKSKVGLTNNNYYKFASNGAGFSATGSGGKTFLQVLQENIDNITNKEEIKQIIVGSGINDAQYEKTFAEITQAIESFCNYCYSQFPNAKVYLMACGYAIGLPFTVSNTRYLMNKIVLKAYSYEGYSHMPIFLDGSNLWLHDATLFSSDNLHPTITGQQVIANKLIKALYGNNYTQFIDANINANIFGNEITINGEIKQELARIFTAETKVLLFTEGNYKSLQSGIWNDIGTFNSNNIHPSDNNSCNIPVNLDIITSNSPNEYINVNGIMRLTYEGKIQLNFWTFIDNQQPTITNIRRINIHNFIHYVNSYEN